MTVRLAASLLADGRRLHLQDGPIDLIIEAWGDASAVAATRAAAIGRAATVLDALCAELPLLRTDAARTPAASGAIARRMQRAVAPHANTIFITPMAAVAGAVADAVLAAMAGAAPLARAYVNNGGDIALHLAEGASLRAGLVDRPDAPALFGHAVITSGDAIRGIATSGWRGRSFSLGIADAVTVLAPDAAGADAAATVIANAVDLPGHPGILRVPACNLAPESDLGMRLVTRAVEPLRPGEITAALDRGAAVATGLIARGLIAAAALHLQGVTRIVAAPETPAGLKATPEEDRRCPIQFQPA